MNGADDERRDAFDLYATMTNARIRRGEEELRIYIYTFDARSAPTLSARDAIKTHC